MRIILLHSDYNESHLADVITEMKTLGAPEIKAVHMPGYDAYVAIEGCHRIRAAAALGLTPVIDEMEYSDSLLSECGIDQIDHDYTVSEICDNAWRDACIIEF